MEAGDLRHGSSLSSQREPCDLTGGLEGSDNSLSVCWARCQYEYRVRYEAVVLAELSLVMIVNRPSSRAITLWTQLRRQGNAD